MYILIIKISRLNKFFIKIKCYKNNRIFNKSLIIIESKEFYNGYCINLKGVIKNSWKES